MGQLYLEQTPFVPGAKCICARSKRLDVFNHFLNILDYPNLKNEGFFLRILPNFNFLSII